MTLSVDQLCQRLVTEQGWLLLTDCDREPPFPEEDNYWDCFDATSDPVEQDRLFLELLDEKAKHLNALPLIGGPFPDMSSLTEIEGMTHAVVITSPALRRLKPYCSRMLVKQRPFAIKVALVIEDHVPADLNREMLSKIGAQAREELLAEPEAEEPVEESRHSAKARKKRAKALKRLPVFFELIVVGQRIQTDHRRKALRGLRQGRLRIPFVAIHGYLLDSTTGSVWSTNGLSGWRRRDYFRYALRHHTDSVPEIQEAILNSRPGALLIIASVAIAVLTNFGFKALVQDLGELTTVLWFAADILVPTAAVLTACCSMRLNTHVVTQTKRFLIGYFAVYSTLFLAFAWIPTFQHFYYLTVVGVVTTVANMMGVYMMSLE
ncbi:hypothetical protein ACJO2E_17980 [Marinobacter sp. M1N3S26]|uniref:hypothetical protein n=1 Tax=Marinobacter sp. M1N3S26 TaxID=3382299 RepID=UPI00387A9729